MSKTETIRQLAVVAREKQIASSSSAIDQVVDKMREANEVAINGLASGLEPLAQSLAALRDQTEESLLSMSTETTAARKEFIKELDQAGKTWADATSKAKAALVEQAGAMKTAFDLSQGEVEKQRAIAANARLRAAYERAKANWWKGLVIGLVLSSALMTGLAIASWIWLGPQGQLSLDAAVRTRLSDPR